MSKKSKFFFQKNDKNSGELFREIELACKGLFYISETDAAVALFSGSAATEVTREIILQQTGARADEPVQKVQFDEFFKRLTEIKDWHGEREKERAKRFLALKMLLEANLRDLKVFRIGKIRIDIYAVGIDKNGSLMGVATKAVET